MFGVFDYFIGWLPGALYTPLRVLLVIFAVIIVIKLVSFIWGFITSLLDLFLP